MTATAARLGTIDWIDLTTPDVDAALRFYGAVLGWTYQTTDSPMGTYHVALVGGHDAAGLMATPEGSPQPATWTVFVRVSSVEETLVAVRNAGGSIVVDAFDIPGDARVGVAADPLGAMFAVIAGGPDVPDDEPPLRRAEAGAVAWCELLSRDPRTEVGFYDAVFGWRPVLDASTGYTTFTLDDMPVGGLLPMPADIPDEVPSHWMVYFHVDDIAVSAQAAAANGGEVLRPPTNVAGVAFAMLADGAGASFGVLPLGG